MSEVSRPVFKLTADGIAMVFDLSAQAAGKSLMVSKKIVIVLEPSARLTVNEFSELLAQMSKGSDASSEVVSNVITKLYKISQPSVDLTEEVVSKILKEVSKGSDISSDVIAKVIDELYKKLKKPIDVVIGRKNIKAGLRLSGKGLSLTADGISAVFNFMTEASTALSNVFDLNREEIEKAVERNDQQTLEGLRELIRSEINDSIENGEVINQLITNDDLDFYIQVRLEAMN